MEKNLGVHQGMFESQEFLQQVWKLLGMIQNEDCYMDPLPDTT